MKNQDNIDEILREIKDLGSEAAPRNTSAADDTPRTQPPADNATEGGVSSGPVKEEPKAVGHENDSYIVPTETFKQHERRRRRRKASRSTHSGTTQSASREELDAEADDFIFTTPTKKRRRRRRGRLPMWAKIVIIILCVVLALVIAVTGTFFVMREIGRSGMHNYENIDIVMPTDDDSGDELAAVSDSGHTIVYHGDTYSLNEDVMSLVFIGYNQDEGADTPMGDAIYILAIDADTGRTTILGVSRDTMTDVNLYSSEGRFIDTEQLQLSYAYSYGTGEVSGGENTNTSLSRMFFGLPLENYFALDLDALVTLNDAIGGVTLTSSITFVSPIDGRTIYEGEEVTLYGSEARYYVQNRDIEVLSSNNNRMQRQQEYIRAFISSVFPAAKKDISIVSDLYHIINTNSDSSLDISKITYLASTAVSKLRSDADIEYVNLTGEIRAGEFAELYVDDEEVLTTMLDVFYTKAE